MDSKVLPQLATPRGRYPHFKRAGDFVFVSGMSARQAGNVIPGGTADAFGTTNLDIRVQTRACIENVQNILRGAGCELSDVVEITTYLVDMNDFGGYNEVYAEFFDFDGPARTTIAVHQLPHPHLRVEIRAVAYKPTAG